jgi:hypothetical protein
MVEYVANLQMFDNLQSVQNAIFEADVSNGSLSDAFRRGQQRKNDLKQRNESDDEADAVEDKKPK